MAILLIGTLDTKGQEFLHLRNLLQQAGQPCLVVDAGVLGKPGFSPDISAEEVYKAAGTTLAQVRQQGDRGKAIDAAVRGVIRIAVQLHAEGKITGIIGLGGSAGTTIATAAMRALPFGFPKLMVSTLASGQVRPFVGVRDIFMLHSVVDISGLNRISRQILDQAANAMLGLVTATIRSPEPKISRPLLTATMFGVTTPCVEAARVQAELAGYEVLVFHATGSGGMTMESFIRDGIVNGVLDLTTTELADELVGGILSAGPDRLTAAAIRGVPQVIAPGAIDMVNFGPMDTVPERFRGRRLVAHNANVTLMRTTPEENDKLGKEIAHKACASRGPTAILLPLRGVSALDRAGQPFWDPEADAALFQSIRDWVSPSVRLLEYDLHINDPEFARAATDTLLQMLATPRRD